MAVVTELAIRWAGGYTKVGDVAAQALWGVKQGFLQLGQVTELDEVTRIALVILGFQGDPKVATTLGVEPDGSGDEPYVDYQVGDTITAPDEDGATSVQRVVSLTVSEDDNGEVTYANELKASFVVQEEAFDRQLKTLLNGTLKGRTQQANPLPTGSVTRAQNDV